jgi:hypothetical protein
VALFAAAALYLLQAQTRISFNFMVALLSGIIASFSALVGLLVWPIGLIEIWYLGRMNEEGERRWLRFSVWLALGALVAALYLHGYTKPVQTPTPLAALDNPAGAFVFYLSMLGSPLDPSFPGATIIGLFVACALIYALVRQARSDDRRLGGYLLAVALFCFAAGAIITAGRMGFGPDQSLQSRYTVFGLIGIAALYLWWARSWHLAHLDVLSGSLEEKALGFSIVALIACGVVAGLVSGVAAGTKTRAERQSLAIVARNFQSEPDTELARLLSDAGFVRQQLTYLKRARLSVFATNR